MYTEVLPGVPVDSTWLLVRGDLADYFEMIDRTNNRKHVGPSLADTVYAKQNPQEASP